MSRKNPNRCIISPNRFIKVYVTPLRRQKRPFRPLPGFRWYPRLRGHKFHCPIIIKIMDRPFLRYRKHLGENRLTRSKGVASSNLGLSSPHKGKGPLFFWRVAGCDQTCDHCNPSGGFRVWVQPTMTTARVITIRTTDPNPPRCPISAA